MAVVHQRISQLSSSGLMNIESSHKLTRSGDTSHECVEGIDVDNYQVEVIGAIQVDLPENGTHIKIDCYDCVSFCTLLQGVGFVEQHVLRS